VRALLPERRLGLLGEDRERALDEHVRGCAACVLEATFERELARGLASLSATRALEIDVADRVLRSIGRDAGPVPSFSGRRLLIAAAVVVAVLLVGLGVTVSAGPSATEIALFAKQVLVAAGSAASRALSLAAPVGRAFAFVARIAGSVAGPLQAAAPAAQVAAAICLVSMALVTATVVARDFARTPLTRKEIS
jgi:hypothetical protein